MFRSLVGLILLATALVGFGTIWLTIQAGGILFDAKAQEVALPTGQAVLVSLQAPPMLAILAAIVIAFVVAGIFIGLEVRDINQSRRSDDRDRKPLAPRNLMAQTRGVFHGEVTVTVLVPAHNEAEGIGATLDALAHQSRPADRVIVVADNCTDDTVAIARARGFEVVESVGNRHKKAGALNQALAKLLPELGPNDCVMIMDADTRMLDGFLETAVKRFTDDRGLSAIGGLFYGEPGHGILGQLQRNEFIRYQREIKRRGGRVFVLTGTASVFRSTALRTVAESRGRLIPGIHGDVYDTAALTEDNELTIALKSLGGLLLSPDECRVETELMPTARTLWHQRLRWQRGALENIAAYGITPTTTRYWSQQLGIAYSVFALWSFFLLIGLQVLATDLWIWYPFWLGMLVVFMTERVVTVWAGGPKARWLAAFIVPELLYDSYLDLIFLKGLLDIALKRQAQWSGTASAAAESKVEVHS